MKDTKKKKPLWKRVLKWTGITFLVLIILLMLIPYFFKDQIVQFIKDEANVNLNATLEFADVDLTFISTFPNLTLTINDLSIKGKDQFADIYLAQIKTTSLKLDFWKTVSGSSYQVEDIYLLEPMINVVVLEDGSANYDIAISDSTATEEDTEDSSPLKFALQHYKIENGDITYDDRSLATFVRIPNLDHEGHVEIDDIDYLINTTTQSSGITLAYDNINYLYNSPTDIKCDMLLNMPTDEMTITFKENEASINKLKLHFDGSMLMKEDFMDFDFTFNTLDQTFKSLLSIVPGAYSDSFDDIKTDGKIDLSGSLTGKYSETMMPGFELKTIIKNAYLQYPDLPAKLNNINIDLNIARKEGASLDNLVIDMKKFNLEFLKNKLAATLYLTHPMSDPNIKSNIQTYLDLAELKKVIPMEEGEDYSGIITSDINLKGNLSSIENEKFDEFEAGGSLKIENMNYASKSLNYLVAIEQMLFEFSPQAMNLVSFDSKIGNSDIHADGTLTNYLAYFIKDETLDGKLNISSTLLDMDELLFEEPTDEIATESTAPQNDSVPAEVMAIPTNINFIMTTKVQEMIYDSLPITNLNGVVILKDGVASMQNIKMGVFDGSITMNGDYQAITKKRAKVDFAYDIKDLDFKQSYQYFNTIEKYASIAKYCDGKFSTTLSIVTEIDENFEPIYESLTGKGNLTSKEVKINSHPIFDKIATMTKLASFKNQKLTNLDLSYEFVDGKFTLKETPIKLDKINSTISGTTAFTEEIDYTWDAKIPKEMFGNNLGNIAGDLLGKLNDATGTNVQIPDLIPVKFNIGGTVTNPTVLSNFKNSGKDAGKDLIDQGKDLAKEKLNEEAKKILADAQKEADKLIAEAKIQADKIRAESDAAEKKVQEEAAIANKKAKEEATKQAAKLKTEGYAAAQKLVDNAKNPIAKIAAQKAAEKANQKTDEQVASLLNKANKKADDAQAVANKNAKKVKDEGYTKADQVESTAKVQADKVMETANSKVDKMTE